MILNGILISIHSLLKELPVILLFGNILNIFLTLCFADVFKLLCLILWKKLSVLLLSTKNFSFSSYKDGFYVYAKPNPLADTNKAIQYVVRYTGRPAMAQSRILNYDGHTVTFWYKRHEDDKKVIESISAFDFIKRLIVHISEAQFKTVRYYGLYAKKA